MAFATTTKANQEALKGALINATKLVEAAIDAQPAKAADVDAALAKVTATITAVG
jgi:hypothetical protein